MADIAKQTEPIGTRRAAPTRRIAAIAALVLGAAMAVASRPWAFDQGLEGPYGQKRYRLPGSSSDDAAPPVTPAPTLQNTQSTPGSGFGYDTGQSDFYDGQAGARPGGQFGGRQPAGQTALPRLRIDVPGAVDAPLGGVNFVVFFPPYSAALDGPARETVLITAELARESPRAPLEILLNPADQDDASGLATLRGESIRQALVRFGVRATRIRVRRDGAGTVFANQPRGALNEVGEFAEVVIRTE